MVLKVVGIPPDLARRASLAGELRVTVSDQDVLGWCGDREGDEANQE